MIRGFFALGAAILLAAAPAAAQPASTDLAPVFTASDWLNGQVRAADVRGKVVLVDVFTFGCINCQHVAPELQKLHASQRSADFAIIGIHAPETPQERDRTNVVSELKRQGIVWPVAIDNNFAIWRAFNNEYWPTQYIFDRHGALRKTIVGEGQDQVVESTVRALVAEKT
ncbi:MAG: thioredoxin family protein [Candidatus Velthaea sp.]